MEQKLNSRTTYRTIGDTGYVVEAIESETAAETTYSKVKRLIMNNADEQIALSNSSYNSIK